MKVTRATVGCSLMAFSFFWAIGCNWIQTIIPGDKPPVATQPSKSVVPQRPIVEKQQESPPKQMPPSKTPEIMYYIHTIKWSGENLIKIARWYTGSGNNWLQLVDANPSIDPRRIKIGDSILIPEILLTTREPMPFGYISSGSEQKNVSSSPSAEPPPSTSDVELFGPIDTEAQTGRFEGNGSPLPLETIE